ncbi:MAG: YCF48-related protein [Bacteroidales bacterium]|nr:YCF48-related protein [Bacteroidales bacterium]
MKNFTILLAIMLTVKLVSAQWIQQNTGYPTNNHNLSDIMFVDQFHGWCVGTEENYGTIDGGNTWESMPNLPHNTNYWVYNSVFFIDQYNGWVSGNYGIYHTNNGGIGSLGTWEEQLHYPGPHFLTNKLLFSDTLNGWLACSVDFLGNYKAEIYKTEDGGLSWIQKFDGFLYGCFLNDIVFSDDLNGWAVGNKIVHSSDGGETWDTISNYPHDYYFSLRITSICFVDSLTGWTVGHTELLPENYSLIYHTSDGGDNWTIQGDTIKDYFLNDITFTDINNGWAVGTNGKIIHTSDGGQNWVPQESGVSTNLRSVCFIDENFGWICGDSLIVLYTENGGIVGLNDHSSIPGKLTIFPNPSKATTKISYELRMKEQATISIRNISGQLLRRIQAGNNKVGIYELNSTEFATGIYFITLITDTGILTEKLIIE